MGTPVELMRDHADAAALACRGPYPQGRARLRMDHYQVLVPDVMKATEVLHRPGVSGSPTISWSKGPRHQYRHLPLPQEQPVGHRVSAPCRPAIPSLRLRGRIAVRPDPRVDCAGKRRIRRVHRARPGRHGHGHAYYTYVRDPDGTAPNCCCPRSRSSTATTSRLRARSRRTRSATAGASAAAQLVRGGGAVPSARRSCVRRWRAIR